MPRRAWYLSTWIVLLVLCAASSHLRADEAADRAAGLELFEKRIRPLLVQHCYECHSEQSKSVKGGLRLDTRDALRHGGDSGPAVVPGEPDKSPLMQAIAYTGEFFDMPPQGKLPDALLADVRRWIELGAPDPREASAAAAPAADWAETLRQRADWWSLHPVASPPLPAGEGTPIDRFLNVPLHQAGLQPADAADPRTLLRRLSLVLTGLPPTIAEADEFSAQMNAATSPMEADNIYASWVERRLASPHFGERWARHWMDVVRFTETHGNEWNYEVHHAWRYRDYLTRAFNQDLPYDQFVREHLAGDLLPQPRYSADGMNESLIGTAFFRFGEVNHDDCIDLPQIGYDLWDNQLDTLTKAFQATTVACARCHDHKLDAVSMRDYYGLLGILRSSRPVAHALDGPQANAEPRARLAALKTQLRRELAALWQEDAQQAARILLQANTTDPADQRVTAVRSWLTQPALPLDDPFSTFQALARTPLPEPAAWSTYWQTWAARLQAEAAAVVQHNQTQFQTLADFRQPHDAAGWTHSGQGFFDQDAPSSPTSASDTSTSATATRPADFALHATGEEIVKHLLPAGWFTHRLSEKLNGTLRSPPLELPGQYVSFQVLGRRSSAVRIVSNGCQLNYRNYRALTNDRLHWITLQIPQNAATLRPYAELMTMLDNPKFPDQLSALGGDGENYRLPWEKVIENPRSYFGVTQVVTHAQAGAPRADLRHLSPLWERAPASLAGLAEVYRARLSAAVARFAADQADDADALWLDAALRRGLFRNRAADRPALHALLQEYRQVEETLALPRVAPGMADSGRSEEQSVFVRGDCTRPGPTTPRRFLEVLGATDLPASQPGSGRLQLAEAIAHPRNPLTARVMANRLWHHVFGAGLVRTVDDFGHVGDLPSHPELLDHLATTFVADGWSVKRLLRAMVLSQAFRRSAAASAEALAADPQNRLLQHYPARRIEAEGVRDLILAASGRLDPTLYGYSVQPYREQANADRRLFPGPLDGAGRRSLYIKQNLMEGPKFLVAFNLPGGKLPQGRRDVSNVPGQALTLLNDPFVVHQADRWAEHLIATGDASVTARLTRMFRTALSRAPREQETARYTHLIATLAELHQVPPAEVLGHRRVWADVAHTLLNAQEFVYIP